MSLNPCPIDPVPAETARVARAAFPKGNRYMTMREELGILYPNDLFADLYPQVGHYGEPPWRLALVTLMQFSENLTDRQAADAVRGRRLVATAKIAMTSCRLKTSGSFCGGLGHGMWKVASGRLKVVW